MTTENPISDRLAATLDPDWTVDRLAEEILGAIAADATGDDREFVLDGDTLEDRQSRRLLRPLLACLAGKSDAGQGSKGDPSGPADIGLAMPPGLYGGGLRFRRPGPGGFVWIHGRFENNPDSARLVLRRSSGPSPGLTHAIAEFGTGKPAS